MKRIAILALAAWLPLTGLALELAAVPDLTAEQIVDKNVAARGGLEAWRKVQTMAWIGHVESGAGPAPTLPFVLQQKRPNKTRFEIRRQNQMSVRVFDGEQGWKLRPSNDGTPDVKPYGPAELAFASDGQGVDGPLLDHAAKGIAVALEGVDEVDGRQAYRLGVRLPSGASHRVWIDAESFLDVRYDRPSSDRVGRPATMSMFYRNYRSVDGLQIPLTMETATGSGRPGDRMVIDRVAVNPPLADGVFARPHVTGERRGAIVDARSPSSAPTRSMLPPPAVGKAP